MLPFWQIKALVCVLSVYEVIEVLCSMVLYVPSMLYVLRYIVSKVVLSITYVPINMFYVYLLYHIYCYVSTKYLQVHKDILRSSIVNLKYLRYRTLLYINLKDILYQVWTKYGTKYRAEKEYCTLNTAASSLKVCTKVLFLCTYISFMQYILVNIYN